MYTEDQLLPISALQHLLFCERQCALIHIEGLWAENRLTVEGRHLHERTHDERRGESRPGVRITRGLNLCSYMLGLVGKADVVEIERVEGPGLRVESWARDQRQGARGEIQQEQSSRLSTLNSQLLRVVPVEYKRGRPKKDGSDRVQLWRKASAWKRCWASRLPRAFCTTAAAAAAPVLQSTRHCAIRRLRQSPACTK